jgi:hypothetical protein
MVRGRLKRASLWIVAVLAVAGLAVGTISWTSGESILLSDERGEPVPEAFVRFHYEGSLINPVHPVTYVARGSIIIRAGPDGRAAIPFRVHVRRPLPLSTPPSAFIDCVYVPGLHNAFGPVPDWAMSRDGVFTVDDERQRITVLDVSRDPERWDSSLRELYRCIQNTIATVGSMAPADPDDVQTNTHARELIEHLRREYAAFLAAYGHTARTRPEPPPFQSGKERRLWQEQVDAHIAREPLWGPYFERMWRGEIKALDGMAAALKQAPPRF